MLPIVVLVRVSYEDRSFRNPIGKLPLSVLGVLRTTWRLTVPVSILDGLAQQQTCTSYQRPTSSSWRCRSFTDNFPLFYGWCIYFSVWKRASRWRLLWLPALTNHWRNIKKEERTRIGIKCSLYYSSFPFFLPADFKRNNSSAPHNTRHEQFHFWRHCTVFGLTFVFFPPSALDSRSERRWTTERTKVMGEGTSCSNGRKLVCSFLFSESILAKIHDRVDDVSQG